MRFVLFVLETLDEVSSPQMYAPAIGNVSRASDGIADESGLVGFCDGLLKVARFIEVGSDCVHSAFGDEGCLQVRGLRSL